LGWAAARQRLHEELLRLRRLGAEVDGEVGEADPVAAIKEVLGSQQVDEIILSTLPQRRSRWLARDLPGRVQRDFGLPVTHVVSEPGAGV
jgi:GABA permease